MPVCQASIPSGGWDMPPGRVLTFDNPESSAAAVRGTNVELLLMSGGDFSAELVQVDFGRLLMQRGADNLPRIVRISNHPKRVPIVFLADSRQAAVRHNGIEVAPGEIIIYSPGTMSHQRTSGRCRGGAMSLTADHSPVAARTMPGRDLPPPSTIQSIQPKPSLRARLMPLHEPTMHLAKPAPDTLANPQVAKSL